MAGRRRTTKRCIGLTAQIGRHAALARSLVSSLIQERKTTHCARAMAGGQRHTLAQAAQFDRACPRGGYLNMTWVTMSARKKYITQNQKYPVYTCRQASSSQ